MPLESPYSPVTFREVDLWDLLFERSDREFPDDKVIYIDAETGRSYTYAQVRSAAIAFGKGLKAKWNWQKGDVLALFSPNSVDYPVVTFGCLWAGGIISPANPAYTADELAFQLRDAGAKALVTQVSALETAIKAAKKVGLSEDKVIFIGSTTHPTVKHFTSVSSTTGAWNYQQTRIDPKLDLAFLVYSSGTTGLPKGVMLTHENMACNLQQLKVGESAELDWKGGPDGQGDKIMAFLPFYHVYALNLMVHGSLYSGLTLIVVEKFDFEKFCKLVQDHKATFAYVVPPVVLLLSKHPAVDKYDLSSLRMLMCGAAPLTHELVNAMYERIKVPIKQAYGLSETSPGALAQRWNDWNKFIGSVGVLIPNVAAKIVDPDEREVAVGEAGEIWLKGPNIFKGYLNNAAGTINAFSTDGYFKTGDVGYVDEKGNFYITDRIKELIKYKGFQVAPAELEGVLSSHPKVNDVAVLGLYDATQATEIPRAYIVPAPGVQRSRETELEIADWLAARVASHKRLRAGVRFVDEIPKTASGKILRRVLRQKAIQEEEDNNPRAKL